jgi:hypothetical protein
MSWCRPARLTRSESQRAASLLSWTLQGQLSSQCFLQRLEDKRACIRYNAALSHISYRGGLPANHGISQPCYLLSPRCVTHHVSHLMLTQSILRRQAATGFQDVLSSLLLPTLVSHAHLPCYRPLSHSLTSPAIPAMSDSSIVQSSGSTASPETSPHEHLIFSTTAARVQASHGLRPSISRNSQDTESTRVDPTHTIASGSSTAGEEEIQPCLIATPSLPGSSQDKEPSQRKPARNIVDNLGSSSLALATGLLPIYFLLFAALAFYKNNAVLESGSQAEWLLVAAKYVCPATQKISNVAPANIRVRGLRCSPLCLQQ